SLVLGAAHAAVGSARLQAVRQRSWRRPAYRAQRLPGPEHPSWRGGAAEYRAANNCVSVGKASLPMAGHAVRCKAPFLSAAAPLASPATRVAKAHQGERRLAHFDFHETIESRGGTFRLRGICDERFAPV